MFTFLKALGKFFLEIAKTLIIDTVVKAILNPHETIKQSYVTGGLRSCF